MTVRPAPAPIVITSATATPHAIDLMNVRPAPGPIVITSGTATRTPST